MSPSDGIIMTDITITAAVVATGKTTVELLFKMRCLKKEEG
jgi:hypothetical protein